MNTNTKQAHYRAIACALLLVPAVSLAAKLDVRAFGSDSPECGSKTDPCRSIQQAIDNASPGSTISVGPGGYREYLSINKKLTIESTHGERATIIEARDTEHNAELVGKFSLVHITPDADGTRFGKRKRGFTIRNATGNGIYSEADKVTIEGNRGDRNGSASPYAGLATDPRGACISVVSVTSKATVRYNTALNCDSGFDFQGKRISAHNNVSVSSEQFGYVFNVDAGDAPKVQNNEAYWDRNGFLFIRSDNTTFYPGVEGLTKMKVQGNIANSGDEQGFIFLSGMYDFDGLIKGNTATRFAGDAFVIQRFSGKFQQNTATHADASLRASDTNGASFEKNTLVWNSNGVIFENTGAGQEIKSVKGNNFYSSNGCAVTFDGPVDSPVGLQKNWWGGEDGPPFGGGSVFDDLCEANAGDASNVTVNPANREITHPVPFL